METMKLPSMADTAVPLYTMAFLLGHQNENLRELGKAMLVEAALAIGEYMSYQEHLKTCPKCALRKMLLGLLAADTDASEQVPEPHEFA